MRVVVVTGSTFEILGVFSSPRAGQLSFEESLHVAARRSERSAVATERSTFEFFTRRPYLTRAGYMYGGHDGRLTDVVRPSVPSADAFESSSGREAVMPRDRPDPVNPDLSAVSGVTTNPVGRFPQRTCRNSVATILAAGTQTVHPNSAPQNIVSRSAPQRPSAAAAPLDPTQSQFFPPIREFLMID